MEERKKIFSEKEATDLVLKAAKLQEEKPEPDSPSYVPGITIEELKRMAKELGVEERYLMRALEGDVSVEPRMRTKEDKKRFLGFKFSEEYEAVVDGELPTENYDVVMEDLTNNTRQGAYAGAMQIGRTVRGHVIAGLGMGMFTMTSRNGRTRLQLKTNAFLPFFLTCYPLFIASMVTLPIMAKKGGVDPLLLLGIFLVGGTAAVFAATRFAVMGQRKVKAKFDSMVKKVEEEIEFLKSSDDGDVRAEVSKETTADTLRKTLSDRIHE